MVLYHGSAYKHPVLKPGYKRSGKKVKWDETESNEWLYATTIKEEAVILALFSYIEKHFDGTEFNWEGKSITVKAKPFSLMNVVIYLYTLKHTGEWVKVNNQQNKLTTEYKTQQTIRPTSVEAVDISEYLTKNGFILKDSTGEFIDIRPRGMSLYSRW